MAPKTKDEAITIIDSSDLVAHRDVLNRLLLPSLSLEFERQDTESPSYFGGLPLLPPDFQWPHWDAKSMAEAGRAAKLRERQQHYPSHDWSTSETGFDWVIKDHIRPLSFLGQVHLPDLPLLPDGPIHPRRGMLYFFKEDVVLPSNWSPRARGAVQVFHLPNADPERLQPLAPPERLIKMQLHGESYRHKCSVSFTPQWYLPEYTDALPTLRQEYIHFLRWTFRQNGRHRLLGNSDDTPAPFGLWESAELCLRGSEAEIELEDGRGDWQVLLQLGEEEELDFAPTGHGLFTITIRTEDLALGDFSKVWFDF